MDIQSLFLGIAIGDAFGAGVEFQDRDWIRSNVDFREIVNVRSQIQVPADKIEAFTNHYKPWDYTDDTEMTIGVAKALSSGQPFNVDLLMREWTREYENGKQTKGFGRNGHGSISWYYEGKMGIEAVRNFQNGRPNPGNAPAMRSVPIGLVDPAKINQYCEANAHATHPNLIAVISSQLIAWATEYAVVRKGDLSKIIPYCQGKTTPHEEYQHYLNSIDLLPGYDDLQEVDFETLCGPQPIQPPYFLDGIKGVPSDSKFTAGCVLYVLKWGNNAFDCLKKAIRLGGDVDSVAALTTGIMGGRIGLDSLPSEFLDQVEGKAYLLEIASRFEKTVLL